ncbi:MAG: preprotein translocase subunit SecG [Candidatus Edwardsbacteria bacterium RIFOXYD12_FULL_50_11]|uniref:Protein-export membrane protein SecG n=1 Tax=Candidatus Edwardsbacteria bacterium GWF2_54_11 TaxID=1817851 RepID=A0A1F5RGR2_9BACT|nr:MAG: preprotein translocase subunit SecG [Candidatus Edwardsbacteria bacterium RifOxyC12_full_54_24]OGF07100.1 MAG: preprotein translocase subunit SecG [Candidatus Edwardsbacteria bacterium RifOxyA12_full_54_48]OGF10935.1 MAG: preprotein translocase subunit SecG [Candidatus Edwardsbacteria bacterium GWE2_54_12]OGF13572.1 MAG: preprotein translocase subunit SecG [Candidatus Edwardsbacteria bacterium GWF2_54_11]OGF15880.1 MAG: preprotein translocase subunit SecG [Candidatus Edwardsbacteria bac
MHTLLLVIHLIACLLLVGVVLMQSGKGGLGTALGGGGETFFGGRGAAPFLTRATTVLAVVFMITSLSLALISGKDRRAASAIEKAMQQEQKSNQQPVSRPGELPANQMPEAPSGK